MRYESANILLQPFQVIVTTNSHPASKEGDGVKSKALRALAHHALCTTAHHASGVKAPCSHPAHKQDRNPRQVRKKKTAGGEWWP